MHAILIGSYRYDTNDDRSDHNYIAFAAKEDMARMRSALEACGYTTSTPPFSMDREYIYACGNDTCIMLGIICKGPWTCYVFAKHAEISDRQAIMNDRWIYRMMRMDDVIADSGSCHPEIVRRTIAVKRWARIHSMYGGSYPSGAAYMLYVINTYKKGYSYDMIFKHLHMRSLYLHPEQGDLYIRSVPDVSFMHLKDTTPI